MKIIVAFITGLIFAMGGAFAASQCGVRFSVSQQWSGYGPYSVSVYVKNAKGKTSNPANSNKSYKTFAKFNGATIPLKCLDPQGKGKITVKLQMQGTSTYFYNPVPMAPQDGMVTVTVPPGYLSTPNGWGTTCPKGFSC